MNVQLLLSAGFIAASLTAKSSFNVKDKVAVIREGCGGIGSAYARSLLSNGLKVVAIVDKNDTNSEGLLREFKKTYDKESEYVGKALDVERCPDWGSLACLKQACRNDEFDFN